MAESAAAILAEVGLKPHLSPTRTPTPAVTYTLTHGSYAAGLVLTASHNPALDHGLKVFSAAGGAILDSDARRIEFIARSRRLEDRPAQAKPIQPCESFVGAYQNALSEWLVPEAFAESKVQVVYDAMHGAGGGILDTVLASAGAHVHRMRIDSDAEFGGSAPDPIPAKLATLSDRVASLDGLALGLATDGDGDRFGVVDGTGRVLSETQVIALLVDDLASSGKMTQGLAITSGTGTLVEKVAQSHGLPIERHPVGFKHLSAALVSGRADVAGEESGGFALAAMSSDKDGLLAGCLLANRVATSGEGLEHHLRRLETRFGSSACGRTAMPSTPRLIRAIDVLASTPPTDLRGIRVESVEHSCGLRINLSDGGFLIFRKSGTEEVVRVYAEAPTQFQLEERLKDGVSLIQSASEEAERG